MGGRGSSGTSASSKRKRRNVPQARQTRHQDDTTSERTTTVQDSAPAPKAEEYNPALAYHQGGEEGLRRTLDSYDVDELKGIIRRRHLDATGRSRSWKGKGRLVDLIVQAAEARANQGEVFRNYNR